jgi:hypothetical protein
MHPQVIGRGHRMMMLDRLITKFKQHEDVSFTTMLDLCAGLAQRQSVGEMEDKRRASGTVRLRT